MNTCPVVTLDGPAGVGKTTLARLLATKLALPCLDTGAMFRTIAYKLGPTAATLRADDLEAACQKFSFSLHGIGQETQLLCDARPVGTEIRTEEIGLLASRIAQRPEVRSLLATIQRRMGEAQALVAEGRDMGTVVFPDAAVKFFLDASPETRAKRRLHDPNSRDHTDLATLIAQIKERDHLDRTRAIAPLIPAKDACCIDTSTLAIEGVLATMLAYIERQGGHALFVC